MNKEVRITVTGRHTLVQGQGTDTLKSISPGTYFQRNGIHYIKYEEDQEGKKIPTLLKIRPGALEVTRSGGTGTHMVFEDSRESVTEYRTAFGTLELTIFAVSVYVEEKEDQIRVHAGYSLEENGLKISDAVLDVCVENEAAK